jgi:hypothetical protein
VGTVRDQASTTGAKVTYQRRESVPRPEGDEEAEVTEEENAAVLVDGIEHGDRLGLLVVGVDLWRRPELLELEAHVESRGMVTVGKQACVGGKSWDDDCHREEVLACRRNQGRGPKLLYVQWRLLPLSKKA